MTTRVVADCYIRPDAVEEFLAAARELRDLTHANDAGCLAYDLFRDTADAEHLTMIEEWESKDALDAHIASAHFQRLFPAFGAANDPARPNVITIYEPAL
ncbi:MAG: antibiotic biosynthesis monooxygenase [Micrococcales bacterium]|nr:antibiotic biosynthesis monooxygenase [Micrococcales bacterium]